MTEEKKDKPQKSFEIGDEVRRKTGEGPLMKIDSFVFDKGSKTIDKTKAVCTWFSRKGNHTATFETKDLMHDAPFYFSTAIDSGDITL